MINPQTEIFVVTLQINQIKETMEIFSLINSMSPYLLLGFFLAGIMHAFVPGRLYRRHLGNNNFKSILYATLIAIPLPLCSCGVIPTAMSLRREGASRGSVISFLIATPQTGVDSILATFSLMGLPFAIIRPIAALCTALFGGIFSNIVESGRPEGKAAAYTTEEETPQGFAAKIKSALKYSFVTMMQDIGKWLVVGLFIAGLITLYVPDELFSAFADNTLLSILIVLICAIPMYLCATGSIPIAIALMMKGLSPGAALVLLMAGPAVNVASILVIHRVMGFRSMLVYLLSIIGGAIVFALGIDYLLPREWFTEPLQAAASCEHGEGFSYIFKWICTGTMLVLLVNALARRFFGKKKSACCESACSCSTNTAAVFQVEGMKCNHCTANAEKIVKTVAGVENAEASLQDATVTVTGVFDNDEVVKALESIGFKAKYQSGSSACSISASKQNQIVYRVEGMKCNHCTANAEKVVKTVPGIESAEASLQDATVTVTGNFDAEEAKNALESIGFKAAYDACGCEAPKAPVVLQVEGMKCNHCTANAEKVVKTVAGVESADASLQDATVTVSGKFDTEEVIKTLESIGFKVKR